MSTFKKGDKIIRTSLGSNGMIEGKIYTFDHFKNGNLNSVVVKEIPNDYWDTDKFKLVINNTNNMSIKEKFITAFLSEPDKSFRKAGITNGDGLLTEEGESIFLTWLLKQQGDAFKTAVVDGLLEDMKND